MEEGLMSNDNGIMPDFDPLSKSDIDAIYGELSRGRHVVERARRAPSPDFMNNPEAGERFVAWFNKSDLTLGENGKHTYKKLGEVMHVSEQTASSYVKNPSKISGLAALHLGAALGKEAMKRGEAGPITFERPYYDLIHGSGSFDRDKAEQAKLKSIRELEAKLSEAMTLLRESSPAIVERCILAYEVAIAASVGARP